ncbi:hypothetical protein LTR67_005074 [Exophiala xenobiotica]
MSYQEWDYQTTDTIGSTCTVSVTRQASITVTANVAIGQFSPNASGALATSSDNTVVKDSSQSVQLTRSIKVPAGRKIVATTSTTTTTNTDTYQVQISIRGRNKQPTLNVPFGSTDATYHSIGTWYDIAAVPNIGPATQTYIQFKFVTTQTNSEVLYVESAATRDTEDNSFPDAVHTTVTTASKPLKVYWASKQSVPVAA